MGLEDTLTTRVADAPSALPSTSLWDSFARYLKTEVVTKAVTLPAVPPIATGMNYLVQRLSHSAKWAAAAGGTTEWALESAVFYGLMWRSYSKSALTDSSTSTEMMKDFWLAEAVDYVARPMLSGLGQYLANVHEPGQHPYRTWMGTVAGIFVADAIFCMNYLIARHAIKPYISSRVARARPAVISDE